MNCGNNTSSIAYYVLLCYVEGNSLQLILMQHHNTFHYKSVLIKLLLLFCIGCSLAGVLTVITGLVLIIVFVIVTGITVYIIKRKRNKPQGTHTVIHYCVCLHTLTSLYS